MRTSSDIQALFDRFQGDASNYREIRVENEARDARDRWPLLGLVDPRRFEAGAAYGSAGEAASEAQAKTEAPHGDTQAELRRTAPLFTHSPRRDLAQPRAPGEPDEPGEPGDAAEPDLPDRK